MAPITRSSVHGRTPDEDSAPLEAGTGDFDSDHEDMTDAQSLQEDSPLQSAHEMLLPLQETANRVSRQVEAFARCLDQFNSQRDVADQQLWEDAWQLLEKYGNIALHRKDHTETSQSTRHLAKNRGPGETDRQISSLQLEADLWSLTKDLLVCKSPTSQAQVKESQESSLSELHRYSTNAELWNAFLNSDEVAQEYECMLDWLQQRADTTSPPIEKLLAPLIGKSERGDGIWSAGLIYTKDAIKKQKRARAWPMTLDPSAPGLESTHRRPHDQALLVAQMDPDAPQREGAKLASQDEFYEEAAWQACWELLRRGETTTSIHEWWSDRKELWRSVLLRNVCYQKDQPPHSPWLRIINIASNPEWFARCQHMCNEELGATDFENAVFGILCGSYSVSCEVSKDMDDDLFSYFNAKLIERYREFLLAYKAKLQNSALVKYQPKSTSHSDVHHFFESAQAKDRIKEELQQPHKFVESALLTQRLDDFFILVGQAAAQMAHMTGNGVHLIARDDSGADNDFAKVAAQNQDSVRMIVHLQLILRSLGFLSHAYRDYEYSMENNIVNYIAYLEREAKFVLLPLYASKLSPSRATHALGTILVKVTDPQERDLQVKLMKQYGIDVPNILLAIFQLANYNDMEALKKTNDARKANKITHCVDGGSVQTTRIISRFIGNDISEQHEKQIKSLEWMKYMDAKNWGMAAWAATTLYKIFLLNGKLAGAKELTQAVNLATISLSATSINLSLASTFDEGSEDGDVNMAGSGSIDDHVQPVSPTRKRREQARPVHVFMKESSSREDLASQSKVWAQLEQLTEALSALERWQDFADEVEAIRGNPSHMRQMKKGLQHALNELQNAMLPLLDRDFLMQSNDDAEMRILAIIRNHYIPECILGYNSALYFAGHALTRRYLVECMNLAQEVAQNETLTEALIAAGRMRELVNAFALDSQALLRANETGGNDKPKKNKRDVANVEGKEDIWQVSWTKENDAPLASL